jgi:uncharacterized protein YbbC (DUF1343 family)
MAAVLCTACVPAVNTGGLSAMSGRVRPGITVLLEDSLHLVRNRRIGLITNQTGVDERGQSDIDLLRGSAARAAGVQLAVLFSPEHGIRGTEDRTQIASGIDEKSGLTIHSLYTNTTIAPPDSTLRGLDALVFDLQDIGTRTWTYTGLMVYALRAAARNRLPLIVLDRPNPLTGAHADGPLLDTALSNTEEHRPDRPGKAYALYPFPLRHGMTMGEMALFYNTVLGLGAPLHVVPTAGWQRTQWFDQTALPWVRPSPNLPTLTSALVYPSLVAFEATRLSVGRGTSDAFQRFGAPWLQAERAAALLNERGLAGVRFEVSPFTPVNPGDRKYDGVHIPGVRVVVTDRDRVHSGRLGAAIIWAVAQTTPAESLQIRPRAFDERFGSTAAREALVRGEDPDAVIDRHLPAVVAFQRDAARFRLYR